MPTQVNLGGDRLGSGAKMQQELHDYQMSSFNLEQDWKSSMAPGILYPFIKMIATNHGTFDIDLDTLVRTIPTKGPLFGSFKLQIDLFNVPFRLYQGILHNNPQEIGLQMNQVYLPKMLISTIDGPNAPRVKGSNDYNYQINESALIKYLGISGIGKKSNVATTKSSVSRSFQCVPVLAYYDIFKNYYANKQEENAYVITPGDQVKSDECDIQKIYYNGTGYNKQQDITVSGQSVVPMKIKGENMTLENVLLTILNGEDQPLLEEVSLREIKDKCIAYNGAQHPGITGDPADQRSTITYNLIVYLDEIGSIYNFAEGDAEKISFTNNTVTQEQFTSDINLRPFKLKNIDKMRSALLKVNDFGETFIMSDSEYSNWNAESGVDGTGLPYSALFKETEEGIGWNAFIDNGLVIKTYQSDIFNNWLNSEYIDGENGISKISAIAVVDGAFTMDSLIMGEKVWNYLNRVLVNGGTYEDWQEATYGKGAIRKAETPMYVGGMSAEIMFEEVISNAETNVGGDYQPLGSLGGRGKNANQKGGKNIHVKFDEPGYLMGIVSITPRICYTQGNDWDMTEIETMDDLHKPALDGIGFQDLIIEQMAWWNTKLKPSAPGIMSRDSAGKQTAWINYQTAVDKAFGDFAKQDGYAYMVLSRNYEIGDTPFEVKDITTYIDPAKYNYAFAYAGLAAQNFWVQIHSKVIARRKMGAQQIPNL